MWKTNTRNEELKVERYGKFHKTAEDKCKKFILKKIRGRASLGSIAVMRHLGKVEIAGSNPAQGF